MNGDLGPGSKLGAYVVLERLGAGAMGVVYKARHETLGRLVALKVITAADPRARERFLREARAVARLSHPNVIGIDDVVEEGDRVFLALELAEGGTLASRLARGRLPWREAVAIVADVARGLSAVHAAGLVHRDVKPANVLFDARGRAKLGDFGLVRDLALPAGGSLTEAGELVGTPAFFSPEQADGRKAGPASDLYALGATLFAALTGVPPFDGTGPALMLAIMKNAPRRPSTLAPDVVAEVDELTTRLLSKDPAARGASTVAVVSELDALLGAPRGRRFPSALLVAILGAAAALLFRSTAPPPPAGPAPSETRPTGVRLERSGMRIERGPVHGTLDRRHRTVKRVALSRDGQVAVTAGDDASLLRWDLAGGGCVALITSSAVPQKTTTGAFAISPDRMRLVTVNREEVIRLWDLEANVLLGEVGRAVTNYATSVTFSDDGRFVAISGWSKALEVRELASGRQEVLRHQPLNKGEARAAEGNHSIQFAAFAPGTSTRLVAGGTDKALEVYERKPDGTWLRDALRMGREGPGHAFRLGAGVWGPGPDQVVTSGWSGDFVRWDLKRRVAFGGFATTDYFLRELSFSRDAGIAVGVKTPRHANLNERKRANTAVVVDVAGGAVVGELFGHDDVVTDVAVSADGRTCATVSGDQTVRVWDIATRRERAAGSGHASRVLAVAFDGDGSIVSGGRDRTLRRTGSSAPIIINIEDGPVRALSPLPDRSFLYLARPGGYHVLEGDRTSFVSVEGPEPICLAAASGRAFLGNDEGLRVVHRRSRVSTTIPLEARVIAVAATEAGHVFAAPEGGSILSFDVKEGVVAGRTWPEPREVTSLAAAGSLVAFGGTGGWVGAWDLTTGERWLKKGAGTGATFVAIAPDQKTLVSVCAGECTVWESKGAELARSSLDDGDVGEAVAFAPDGRGFVIGCARGPLRRFTCVPKTASGGQ